MTWFRIDDSFADHPRVIAAGNAAIGLWAKAGAYSMRHLTEGFISTAVARQLGTQTEIKKLVTVGLWLPADGGYMFFRWAEGADGQKRQETKEEAEDRRRSSRARTAKWRERKQETTTVGDLPGDAPVTDVSRVSDASRDALVTLPSSSSSSSTEVQKQTEPDGSRTPAVRVTTKDFEEFWAIYPRKVGKERARSAFPVAARKAGGPQVVIDGATRLAEDPNLPEREFIPHPATWLTRGGWGDEPLPPRGGAPAPVTPTPFVPKPFAYSRTES